VSVAHLRAPTHGADRSLSLNPQTYRVLERCDTRASLLLGQPSATMLANIHEWTSSGKTGTDEPVTTDPRRSPTLLIADDDPEVHEITRALARELGFEIVCQQPGVSVFSAVADLKPAAALVDVAASGRDAVDIAIGVSSIDANCHVLLTCPSPTF